MKRLGIAALLGFAATLAAMPLADAESVLIQSCKLPSGVTVVHNGHCDDLKRQGAGEDFAHAPGSGGGVAPRSPAAGLEGVALKRDAFLAVMNGTVNSECENPKSKLTCMVKTADVCRKTMPLATAHCEKVIRSQMPEQITSKADGQYWATQLGQCVGNQFLVLAGSANLDVSRCQSAASDNTNDVGMNLVGSWLRKGGVRR